MKAQARLRPYLTVLDELAAGIGAALPLSRWGPEDCRTFATNIDLPQYAESFRVNRLSGERLSQLTRAQLPQLGVARAHGPGRRAGARRPLVGVRSHVSASVGAWSVEASASASARSADCAVRLEKEELSLSNLCRLYEAF